LLLEPLDPEEEGRLELPLERFDEDELESPERLEGDGL
jgi:hypothetical protein